MGGISIQSSHNHSTNLIREYPIRSTILDPYINFFSMENIKGNTTNISNLVEEDYVFLPLRECANQGQSTLFLLKSSAGEQSQDNRWEVIDLTDPTSILTFDQSPSEIGWRELLPANNHKVGFLMTSSTTKSYIRALDAMNSPFVKISFSLISFFRT